MAHARTMILALITASFAPLLGCDAQPRTATVDAEGSPNPPRPTPDPLHTPAPRAQAAKPDLARLRFDPAQRLLTLYELPDRSARWMLSTPSNPAGVPVDREYQFPPSMHLDLEHVAVFYTVPNRLPSTTVTLREILDSGGGHAHR